MCYFLKVSKLISGSFIRQVKFCVIQFSLIQTGLGGHELGH